MQADAVLLCVVLHKLAQEGKWSLCTELRLVFERKVGRKLGEKAFLRLLLSDNQKIIHICHDQKLLPHEDAWICFVLSQTKFLKLV